MPAGNHPVTIRAINKLAYHHAQMKQTHVWTHAHTVYLKKYKTTAQTTRRTQFVDLLSHLCHKICTRMFPMCSVCWTHGKTLGLMAPFPRSVCKLDGMLSFARLHQPSIAPVCKCKLALPARRLGTLNFSITITSARNININTTTPCVA